MPVATSSRPPRHKSPNPPMLLRCSATTQTENNVLCELKNCDSGVEAVIRGEDEEQKEFQLQLAKDCFEKGIAYWSDAEYDAAILEFRRALEIREDILGKYDEETAKSYLWVGSLHWHKSEYEKALDNFSRCFRIKLKLSGTKEGCGIVTNWISKVLDAKNVEDKDLYWKKLMSCIRHEANGDSHFDRGQLKEAIQEYRTAVQLEDRRRQTTSASRETRPLVDAADLHLKIARCYLEAAEYDRAVLELRLALCIYLAKFGRFQRYSAETYQEMGAAYKAKGWSDAAINDYLNILYDSIVHEKSGDMLLERKDSEAALNQYQQALRLEESGMGKLQLPSAFLYNKVAAIYTSRGKIDLALIHHCKALGIFEAYLGAHHLGTIATSKRIRALYLKEPQA